MKPAPRIVQIIPAGGWRWRLDNWGADEIRALTCFALVEWDYGDGEPPEHKVEGVDLRCDGLYGLVEAWARLCSNREDRRVLVEYVAPPGEHEDRPEVT